VVDGLEPNLKEVVDSNQCQVRKGINPEGVHKVAQEFLEAVLQHPGAQSVHIVEGGQKEELALKRQVSMPRKRFCTKRSEGSACGVDGPHFRLRSSQMPHARQKAERPVLCSLLAKLQQPVHQSVRDHIKSNSSLAGREKGPYLRKPCTRKRQTSERFFGGAKCHPKMQPGDIAAFPECCGWKIFPAAAAKWNLQGLRGSKTGQQVTRRGAMVAQVLLLEEGSL